jgi:hypothetical protein
MEAEWFMLGFGVLFAGLVVIVVRRGNTGDRHGTAPDLGRTAAEAHHFNQNAPGQ